MEQFKQFLKKHEEAVHTAIAVGSASVLVGFLWGLKVAINGSEIVSLETVLDEETGEMLFLAMTKNGGYATFDYEGEAVA